MTQWNIDSSSAANIKDRLSNLEVHELKTLHTISQFRMLKDWLQRNGWINVLLGGLTVWWVSPTYGCTIPKLLQILIGLLIIGQALWAIVSPKVPALLRFAIVLLMAGVWNVLVAISGFFVGGTLLFGLLGIAQFRWAYQMYKEYQRYQRMSLSEPPADVTQFYDAVWRTIIRGELKNDPTCIHLWIGLDRWRGLLLDEIVIFAHRGYRLLIIQHKDEANFTPNSSRAWAKRRVYGRIKLNTVFERALMQRDSYRKYAQWKGDEALLAETPSLWQRLPQVIRMLLMVIAGLFLVYIAFMVIGMIKLWIQYG